MISWTELVTLEPQLSDLEEQVRREAQTASADPLWSFSAYWSWTLRPAIKPLVGWDRATGAHPQLLTEEAWHAAISHLVGLLPVGEGAWAS
ncbi:hypothetical protein [Streptomyces sp. NBC_00932]|uniref:hypothetical protein n=1 Tax=Streptomyces sp. NBC_00932 TaxID=2903690 RepID=UPI0038648B0E|nr:hypothetical protein OG221_27610 [Streptomyces sp. NBC_00932]